jgi:transposase-like protein
LTFCQEKAPGYNKAKGTGIIEKATKLTLKPMPNAKPLSQFPSEKQVLKKLKKIIFGKKVKCPHCHLQNSIIELKKNRLWRCRKCRKRFSITSVNWLKGMKISSLKLWIIVWCWQKKMDVIQAADLCQSTIPTIRRYYELFRDNLQLNCTDILLEGKVQMDEMFVKGAFIMGAKDIIHKKIKMNVVFKKYPEKHDAMDMLFHHVKPGSTVFTDGSKIYRKSEQWWPIQHQSECHNKFEFSLTSEIEGMWGVLRTFIRRMYHHVTLKNLVKVVAEFEARFSHKELFKYPLNFLENSLSPVPLAF